jgi:hypothetical protein
VALTGFGLDSLIEIGASTVVVWELSGTGPARQRRALSLIGVAFGLLAVYLAGQSTVVLAAGWHPRHSPAGIGYRVIGEAPPQAPYPLGVQFDTDDPGSGGDQLAGQRPVAGADVHDQVSGPDGGVSDDPRGPRIRQRVPAPRLRR